MWFHLFDKQESLYHHNQESSGDNEGGNGVPNTKKHHQPPIYTLSRIPAGHHGPIWETTASNDT